MIEIWVEPHERHEAISVYDWLTEAQKAEIADAPDDARVCIKKSGSDVKIVVVEEG